MSTPTIKMCTKCYKTFVFLRGALEQCPHCDEKYRSHRDADTAENKKKLSQSQADH